MSSELREALAHAEAVEHEQPLEAAPAAETFAPEYKRPVTHGLAEKLKAAGFDLPPEERPMRAAQKRRHRRDKRSEGETRHRGGSADSLHPGSNTSPAGETTMSMHTPTGFGHDHNDDASKVPPIPPVGQPALPAEVAAAATMVGSMADHFIASVKKPNAIVVATDVGTFTVKAAIATGFFAAGCLLAKRIFRVGAPST